MMVISLIDKRFIRFLWNLRKKLSRKQSLRKILVKNSSIPRDSSLSMVIYWNVNGILV